MEIVRKTAVIILELHIKKDMVGWELKLSEFQIKIYRLETKVLFALLLKNYVLII
jgi:hypothetical protein